MRGEWKGMREKICTTIDYIVDRTPLLLATGATFTGIAFLMGIYGLILFLILLAITPMYFHWTLNEGEVPEIQDHEEDRRAQRWNAM
jgi:hypothetical protein